MRDTGAVLTCGAASRRNGAGMRYESEGGDEANAGLQHARAFLEPVKAKFDWISYAE